MNEYCNRGCGREAVVVVDRKVEERRLIVCASCFDPSDMIQEFRRPTGVPEPAGQPPPLDPDPELERAFCEGCGHVLERGAKPGFCEICESAEAFLAGLERSGAVDLEDSGFQVAKDLQRGEGVA